MKTFLILLILVLVSSLTSCGKERTIQISAKNAATGEVYGGLHYVVGYSTTTGSGEKSHTVHSGNLDDNGLATVVVRVKRNRTYYVHVDEPENTCYNKFITMYFNSPFDEDGHFNFEFAECAQLMQNINNVNCQGSSDYMVLYTQNGVNSLGSAGWEFHGCSGYTGDHFSSVPMGFYYFKWTVTRNGNSQKFYDTIYLAPNEQRIYDINY